MDLLFTHWWAWVAFALLLGIAEILAPSYVFLGFAIGAFAVAMLILNTGLAMSLPLMLLIFAALSLIAWLALRHFFSSPKGQVKTFDHDIND